MKATLTTVYVRLHGYGFAQRVERPVIGIYPGTDGDLRVLTLDDNDHLFAASVEDCEVGPFGWAEEGVLFYAHHLKPDLAEGEDAPPEDGELWRVFAVLPGATGAQFVAAKQDFDLVATFQTLPAAEFIPCGETCPGKCERDAFLSPRRRAALAGRTS